MQGTQPFADKSTKYAVGLTWRGYSYWEVESKSKRRPKLRVGMAQARRLIEKWKAFEKTIPIEIQNANVITSQEQQQQTSTN